MGVPYLTILDHVVFVSVATLCVMSAGQCASYFVGHQWDGFWGTAVSLGSSADYHSNSDFVSSTTENSDYHYQISSNSNSNKSKFHLCSARYSDLVTLTVVLLMQTGWALRIYSTRLRSLRYVLPELCSRLFEFSSSRLINFKSLNLKLLKTKMFSNFKVEPIQGSSRLSSSSTSYRKKDSVSADTSQLTSLSPAPPSASKDVSIFGTRTWRKNMGQGFGGIAKLAPGDLYVVRDVLDEAKLSISGGFTGDVLHSQEDIWRY